MTALEYARIHDWGANAYQIGDTLYNIEDTYTTDGITITEYVTLPASIAALREFGGY